MRKTKWFGGTLLDSTINKHRNSIRKFWDYLRSEEIKVNPIKLRQKKSSEQEERTVLSIEEIEQLYSVCDSSRSELSELRISDVNFETGEVFVHGQLKTNSRRLKLEPSQSFHLYDYLNKYRKDFLASKKNAETDRFFLSTGTSEYIYNTVTKMLEKLRKDFPYIEDLRHIRGSVITHWQKQEGIMEAMVKAGHRYVSSTQRYQTSKYEELQEQLRNLHPLEHLNT